MRGLRQAPRRLQKFRHGRRVPIGEIGDEIEQRVADFRPA